MREALTTITTFVPLGENGARSLLPQVSFGGVIERASGTQDELDGLFKEPVPTRKPMNREVPQGLDDEERGDAHGSGA